MKLVSKDSLNTMYKRRISMKLGICGAGGLGREVYELVKQINNAHKEYDEILFIVPPPHPQKVN